MFWVLQNKDVQVFNNSPIRIYANKIENRITFETKTEYCLKLFTPEKIKLLVGTKSKITKDENGKKCASLKNYWNSISPG